MHTKQQRLNIYKQYLKQHPEIKSGKLEDIEEMIAEDFRKYMESSMSYSPLNILKKTFNALLKLIKVSRNKDLMTTVFERIKNGDYSNVKLDQESIKEFASRFPQGVSDVNFTIPGVNQKTLNKFKGITDYHTFYLVGQSLAMRLL
ncbi:hypothetical protein [Sharpea azabuensis]|uniref:hypothetical protein n=1 Tax=Sharpea azabuensis TaxID=322505 RepID=UPI001567D1B6|nr:hypothetical protein [Sharpea azabuensis]